MYFSLVTIATLGYGDLASATELGRLMATVEAVIGRIRLVAFVALLAGLYATRRARTPANEIAAADDSGAFDRPGE